MSRMPIFEKMKIYEEESYKVDVIDWLYNVLKGFAPKIEEYYQPYELKNDMSRN